MRPVGHIVSWAVPLLTLWWGGAYAWVIWKERPAVIKFEDGRVTSARSYVVEARVRHGR